MEPLSFLVLFLLVQGLGIGSFASELDPNGKHVCRSDSHSHVLTCCPGWKQEGRECTLALCEGAAACQEDEVCVRPGFCRCKPGFFGASCNTRCPDEYWGPDCKENCLCFPNGKCDPASGECTCHPGRWGALCQFACQCGPHGHCNPTTGACHCKPGWWAPDCKKQCLCNLAGSRCDPATGRCICDQGWWGRKCSSPCHCNHSPCAQESGRCECRAGLWGASCQHQCQCVHGTCSPQDGQCLCDAGYQGQRCTDPCPAGTFGPQCRYNCGHCKQEQPCSPVDGFCLACDSGWNGTRCNQPCPPGHYGENCAQLCPRCHRGETCHPKTGECRNCEPGLRGARCELPCPPGLFGKGCQLVCPSCFNGSCDPVSGMCVCQAGYWGASCNQTCLEGFYGPNCSELCQCPWGPCHPSSGDCQWRGKRQEVLLVGILVPLLLLLLLCICCCFCCRSAPVATNGRVAAADGDPVSQVKLHVQGALANLRSSFPCFSLGGYKLPRVTVSHHDAEIPFNPSFLESPSAAWPIDSSFSDTDEEEDTACHLPTKEGRVVCNAPDVEPQPGLLPEVSALNLESFVIPRTSSIAKAKRPSVSFAEGTCFGPQSARSSTETLHLSQKPKTMRSVSQVALLHQPGPGREQGNLAECCYENLEASSRMEEGHRPSPRSTPGGPRKRISNSRHVAQRVEALEAALSAQGKESCITTIYVTVGKGEGRGKGPEQAALQQSEGPKLGRSIEGLQMPPGRTPDSDKGTRGPLSQGKPDPESKFSEAEAQGLLGSLPAAACEEAAQNKRPSQSHSQTEVEAGASNEEAQEPKYENVSGLIQLPIAS
ncbi:scavenger receptor class F member 1 [Eublepharis macularius]|uniref:Scavenger receptor class F member 1 n=1 Tax=Eublepharis macularius TaxID=481883 RepID=A0AA97LJK8_EUBMA|nr:scavenger receptor class F member 1 [Eublepharis macularius]